jgi:hypothetical protein
MGGHQLLVVTSRGQDKDDVDATVGARGRRHRSALLGALPDDRLERPHPGFHLQEDDVEVSIKPDVARSTPRTWDR